MTAAMLVLTFTAAAQEKQTMIVRLAEIEVYPQHLKEYLEFANEVDRLSVEREPGVVCLFPMQSAEGSTKIRILEIYASPVFRAPLPQILNYPKNQAVVCRKVGKVSDPC